MECIYVCNWIELFIFMYTLSLYTYYVNDMKYIAKLSDIYVHEQFYSKDTY